MFLANQEGIKTENDEFNVTCNPAQANIIVSKVFNGFKIKVTIYFTSQRFNPELDGAPEGG